MTYDRIFPKCIASVVDAIEAVIKCDEEGE